MDWQPLDSKKLAAVAYVPETGILYLRFRIGEIYAYFPFLDAQHQEFLRPNLVAATSSATSAANSATSALPSHKSLKQSRRPPSDAYTRTPVVVFVIDVRRIGVTGRYSGFRAGHRFPGFNSTVAVISHRSQYFLSIAARQVPVQDQLRVRILEERWVGPAVDF